MFKRTKLCSALMLAFGGCALMVGLPAAAQDSSGSSSEGQKLERVEITGSSIKRIQGETALPVQVLTRDAIQKTGAQNVEQLLQTISAVTSSGGFSASSASGATTGGLSAASIHGLTSLRTLVLINGRRVSPYGIGFTSDSVSVDVNSIPLAAIERVEVLKDGASAVYGSDAIAGVINFILRKDFKGIELTAEYGDTTHGGADFKRVTGTFGFGNISEDRFNVMLVGSYQKEGSLVGGQRGFASSGINPDNDTSSGNTFPGNIAAADGSFGTHNPANPGCPGPYSVYDPQLTATGCRFDPASLVTLIPQSERASFLATGKFAITNDIEAYAEGSYNRNEIRTIIQPVPLSDQFALPPNNPLYNLDPYNGLATFLLKPSSAFYPTAYVKGITGGATPDLLVRYRAAANGNRDITDISEAPRAVIGVRGALAGWDFDVAGLYTESKVREQVNDGYPAYTKIMPLLNSGLVNPFGPNTPEIDQQLKAANFYGDAFHIKTSLTSLAGKVSKEVMQLPAGSLAVAAGVEGRQEKYLFDPNPTIQTGDISGYGGNFLTTDKSRKVGAVFAEVNVPIVKGLEADAAVRFDRYGGVGNSTTPKASLRWQPIDAVLVRGSIGKGFRAPSLQDLYLPQTTGVSTNGLNDPLRCVGANQGSVKDCNTQFSTLNGGNPNLSPEKSVNTTFGVVLEPIDSVSLAIDYFRVNVKETITQLDPAVILQDAASVAKYASSITRAPRTARDIKLGIPGQITSINTANINLGEIRIAGYDIDLKYRLSAGEIGRFTFGLDGTYFLKYDTQNPDGTFTGGVDQINTATGGVVPRWHHYLSVDWVRGPWNLNLGQNFQKGYNDIAGNVTGAERRVGDYSTWDLQSTYSGFKNLKLTLGMRNIFDTAPPYTNSGGAVAFQAGYDNQYGDPRGRFIYGRVGYTFN